MAEPKGPPSLRSLIALITAVAGLVTALGGLVTAIAAHTKQPEEPAAKESYVVVQKALEEVSIEVDACRSDVDLVQSKVDACRADTAALQAAFNDYVHAAAKQVTVPFVASPRPVATAQAAPALGAPPAEDAGAPEHDFRPSHARKKASVRMPAYSDIESKARR